MTQAPVVKWPVVSSDVQDRAIPRVVDAVTPMIEQALIDLLEDGFGPFHKAKPRARLEAYMAGLLPEDEPRILGTWTPEGDLVEDKLYWAARKLGQAPMLYCEFVRQQEAQAHQQQEIVAQAEDAALAAETGIAAAPTGPTPPPVKPWHFFALAMTLPQVMIDHLLSDFRTLAKAEVRKAMA